MLVFPEEAEFAYQLTLIDDLTRNINVGTGLKTLLSVIRDLNIPEPMKNNSPKARNRDVASCRCYHVSEKGRLKLHWSKVSFTRR